MRNENMHGALYMKDCYLKECTAVVKSVNDEKYIVLDKTVFYPQGGGVPSDTGNILKGDDEYGVVFVGKVEGEISHEVDRPGIKEGDEVKCIIDCDGRSILHNFPDYNVDGIFTF